MASVQSDIECPRCSFVEAIHDIRFGSYESVYCPLCGYSNEYRWEGGGKETTVEPIGAYGVYDRSGGGFVGNIASAEALKAFVEEIQGRASEFSRAFYTNETEPGVWSKVYLVGEPTEGELISSNEVPEYYEERLTKEDAGPLGVSDTEDILDLDLDELPF